jgi:hypothetical protein
MTRSFAPLLRTLAVLTIAVWTPLAASAQPMGATPPPDDNGTIPAGGRFKECHGYVRHVSDLNMKVHCIDGNPSDQSFLYIPRFVHLRDGKSIQTKDLTPETPVHIYYTQSLGIKKAYKVYVADPNGNGVYGFRT